MEFSLAPMEGITGYVTRNAFHHNFDYIDKYYTPFIPAAKKMSKKILRDINPENNKGINLIPQIMSNRVDEVLDMGNQLKAYIHEHKFRLPIRYCGREEKRLWIFNCPR